MDKAVLNPRCPDPNRMALVVSQCQNGAKLNYTAVTDATPAKLDGCAHAARDKIRSVDAYA